MFLEKVKQVKLEKVAFLKKEKPLSELKRKLGDQKKEKRSFYEVFSGNQEKETKIIAEIKKASPAKGVLNPDLKPELLASIYEKNGAKAVSVITEEKFFLGSPDFIPLVKKAVSLPVLRKDFIVDEYEIAEAKLLGADAVLLIGEMLDPSLIGDLIGAAKGYGLDVLLEVHSRETYESICHLNGFVLGINNRNLKTLKVELDISIGLLKEIKKDFPVIVESGIEEREEIQKFISLGASGFLIGSSLVTHENPGKKLLELRGVL
ncbi:MAG TPA: indole-3-glycerol phosphate synthase TrpC [Spirochaetia bacterium]|nr:MAG: hypothetical protein A2Y41_01785 [Spirochaetes bacterium GWB1_36_13]HCL56166.1 indole-3-glycerol phosphate synthase TrpC [Spirochaetia bacterium]